MDITSRELVSFKTGDSMAEVVRISPCGRWMAVVSGALELYDLTTKSHVATLGKERLLAGFDGEHLILSDGEDTYWQPLPEGPAERHIKGFAAYSRNSDTLIGLTRQALEVRDFSGNVVATHPRSSAFYSEEGIAMRPDGMWMGGSDGGKVNLWKKGSKKAIELTTVTQRDVTAIAFHPKWPVVAFGTMGSSLCIHEVESGATLIQIPLNAEIRSLTYSPDGTMLAVGLADQKEMALLFLVRAGYKLGEPAWMDFRESGDCVFGVSFSADGKTLAVGRRSGTVSLYPTPLDTASAGGRDAVESLGYINWMYTNERYGPLLDSLEFLDVSDWTEEQKGWRNYFEFTSHYYAEQTDQAWALRSRLDEPGMQPANRAVCCSMCIEMAGNRSDVDAVLMYAERCIGLRQSLGDQDSEKLARKVAFDTLMRMGKRDLARPYSEPGLLSKLKGFFGK